MTRANKAGHRQLQEAQLTTCIAFCRACAAECSRHARHASALRGLRRGLQQMRGRLHRTAHLDADAGPEELMRATSARRERPRSFPDRSCASARTNAGRAATDKPRPASHRSAVAKRRALSIRSPPITVSLMPSGSDGRAAVLHIQKLKSVRQRFEEMGASSPPSARTGTSGAGAPSAPCLERRPHPASRAACRKRSRPTAVRNSPSAARTRSAARGSSTALRKCRSASECGAMKSVERVECPIFSSAACMRS